MAVLLISCDSLLPKFEAFLFIPNSEILVYALPCHFSERESCRPVFVSVDASEMVGFKVVKKKGLPKGKFDAHS